MNQTTLSAGIPEMNSIADHARELGCTASVEYPGFVYIRAINGRWAAVGTTNGPWQADIHARGQQIGANPFESVTVPDSHAATAEGIARYVVGVLAGIFEYKAYASERARKAADRAERRARNGRS